MNNKTIAVDFDGVIAQFDKGWNNGVIEEEPVTGSKESLERLVKNGFTIVIFTTRFNSELNGDIAEEQKSRVNKWLDSHGFKKDIHYHEITSTKPKAIAYIDDRGIRFTNWQDILKYFI